MDSLTWGFIGTIAGAIVGAGASILTTIINSNKAIKLQNKSDNFKRQELAREFQRENLLKLQDTASKALRNCSRGYFADLNNFKNDQDWGKSLIGEELAEEIMISIRELSILTERVANDSLRNRLGIFRKLMTVAHYANSKSDADEGMKQLGEDFNSLMPEIGKELRSNFEDID